MTPGREMRPTFLLFLLEILLAHLLESDLLDDSGGLAWQNSLPRNVDEIAVTVAIFDLDRPAAAVFIVDPAAGLGAQIQHFAARFELIEVNAFSKTTT
jgi:hypothetical protein